MRYVIMLVILQMSIVFGHCLTLLAAQEVNPKGLRRVLKRASDCRGYSFTMHTAWYIPLREVNELAPHKIAEVSLTGKGISQQTLSFSYHKTCHLNMPHNVANKFSYVFFYDINRSVLWFENRTHPRDLVVIKYDIAKSEAPFPNPVVDDMGLIPGTDLPASIKYWLTHYDLRIDRENDHKGKELHYIGELKEGAVLARLRLMGIDPDSLPKDFINVYKDDIRQRFNRAKVVITGNMVKDISFISRNGGLTQHTSIGRFDDVADMKEGNLMYHPPKDVVIRKQALE